MIFDDLYNIFNWLPWPIKALIIIYIIFKASTSGVISTKEKTYYIKEPIPYFHDIPTTDLELALWIGIKFHLIQDKYDFFGVMLLKWLQENKISFKEVDGKIYIDFNTHIKTEDNYERDFYHMFLIVSGTNHYLEENEFVNYLLYNPKVVEDLYESVLDKVTNKLHEKELITRSKNTLIRKMILGPEIKELAMNMAGLKKFLTDFSIIETKKAEEVVIWEYYLIYAQAFGMASEIQEQFKIFYPNKNKINNLKLANIEAVHALILSIKLGLNSK